MPHYVFYEMGGISQTFGNRHSCFTTGFAVFMRDVCMDALKCEDLEADTRKTIEAVEPRFVASGLNFLDLLTNTTCKDEKAHRVKDAPGNVIIPSRSARMLRLRDAASAPRERRQCLGEAVLSLPRDVPGS